MSMLSCNSSGTEHRTVVTTTESRALSGMDQALTITHGEPRLLPPLPAQLGALLAFLSQGHVCFGLGLNSENPLVTVKTIIITYIAYAVWFWLN